MEKKIFDLKLKGYCCSQIIMQIGLDYLETENQGLIDAMGGLCEGVHSGSICGVLSAAICLFHLADPETAAENSEALTDWFEATFECINCRDILGDSPINKIEKCPVLVQSVMEEVCDMLDWYE